MGQTCSSPTRSNVLRGLNFGADSFLELAGVVPFVGNFFDLIRSLKEQWGVLSTRIEEAREVDDWATEELAFLTAFARQAGLRLGEDLPDVTQRELQRAVNQLERSILALNEEARRITAVAGNLARQRVRAALNGEDFESAKQAVEDAKELFSRALMVRVDRGVQRLEEGLREYWKEQREMWIAQREFNRSISARYSQSQLLCALACGGLLVHSANIGVLDLSPGFTNRVYLWLRYSNASVAIRCHIWSKTKCVRPGIGHRGARGSAVGRPYPHRPTRLAHYRMQCQLWELRHRSGEICRQDGMWSRCGQGPLIAGSWRLSGPRSFRRAHHCA